ncbi:MAG: hypothetical protein HY579_13420 [Nitrospinae bacterium]|nr:hypothetical protein [Nitrospinota bacterium]MBI5428002.1 hypothetical protein [Nitrospinota bacterium]
MTLEGEITDVACPPNKADVYRTVTVWLPETQEHMEFTFNLQDFQKSAMKEGDKIRIQIDKTFDVDALTREIFKNA